MRGSSSRRRLVPERVLVVMLTVAGAFSGGSGLAFALFRDVSDEPARFLVIGLFSTLALARELSRRRTASADGVELS